MKELVLIALVLIGLYSIIGSFAYKSRFYIFRSKKSGMHYWVNFNDNDTIGEDCEFVKTCKSEESAIIETERLNKNN